MIRVPLHKMQATERRTRLHVICLTVGLLVAATLSVICVPVLLRHNKRNARLIFRQRPWPAATIDQTKMPSITSPDWRPWLQRNDIRVSAMVFYGRRKYVRVLDKYLKRNLWTAGGVLQEVLWLVRTDDPADLMWLDRELIPSEPGYIRVNIEGQGFGNCYSQLASNKYYLKLDDDIMFIKDKAIDAMLREKLTDRFWIVSANVINHTILTWVHAAMAALTAQHIDRIGEAETSQFSQAKMELLQQEPFSAMQYQPYDECTWKSSHCAAVTHYAFLENVLHNSTDKYDFKQWDFHAFEYRRWSINTILFKGSDLNNEKISDDDEQSISADLPREKGRHCGAVGQALVVHLAYFPQRNDGADKLLPLFEDLANSLTGPLLPELLSGDRLDV